MVWGHKAKGIGEEKWKADAAGQLASRIGGSY